jgi:hypothetical protein
VLADLASGDLIGRDAELDVGALGPLRMDAAQPRCRPARVIACAIVERVRLEMGEPARDQQLVAEGLERSERRRQLEAPAGSRGRPLVHHRAVRHVDEGETAGGFSRSLVQGGHCRDHRVEQRQSHRGPKSAQERAPRQRQLGNDHDCDLLI